MPTALRTLQYNQTQGKRDEKEEEDVLRKQKTYRNLHPKTTGQTIQQLPRRVISS